MQILIFYNPDTIEGTGNLVRLQYQVPRPLCKTMLIGSMFANHDIFPWM